MSELPARLQDDYQARLADWSDIQDHMPYLLQRAEGYPRVRVLELGVRSGNSTAAFLAAAARVSGHVWSVDVNPAQVPEHWQGCGYWTFTQMDDMDYAPELVHSLVSLAGKPVHVYGFRQGVTPQFDVLFIDTSHTVDHTLAELRRFVPYVAPGGVVLMHDTKLADPAAPDVRPYVAQALDMYCAERGILAQPRDAYEAGPTLLRNLTWTERGGPYGLGVIEAPNG